MPQSREYYRSNAIAAKTMSVQSLYEALEKHSLHLPPPTPYKCTTFRTKYHAANDGSISTNFKKGDAVFEAAVRIRSSQSLVRFELNGATIALRTNSSRGLSFVILDERSHETLDIQTFDTYNSCYEVHRMVEFIGLLPEGCVVLVGNQGPFVGGCGAAGMEASMAMVQFGLPGRLVAFRKT
jgi:hypothetical protein